MIIKILLCFLVLLFLMTPWKLKTISLLNLLVNQTEPFCAALSHEVWYFCFASIWESKRLCYASMGSPNNVCTFLFRITNVPEEFSETQRY